MAYSNSMDLRGAPAAADHSTKRGYACVINSAKAAAVFTTAGARPLGVIVEGANAVGDTTTYATRGVVPVSAGAAFAAGVDLMINNEGQFVAATSTNHIVAFSLEASSGDNAIVSAELGYRGVA